MTKIKNPLVNYENKWVALTPDNKKVIMSAKDLKSLHNKLLEKKVKKNQAVLMWVPPFNVALIPNAAI